MHSAVRARGACHGGSASSRLALSGADALTTRERQGAQLASKGYSNREIAKKLVIT